MKRALLASLLLAACSDDGVGVQPWDLGSSHPQPEGSETGDDSEGDAGESDGSGGADGWSPADESSTTDEPEGDSTGLPPDVGEPCPPDPNEPSDAMAQANDLGEIKDCDDDGQTVSGMLDGPDDVDWIRYSGNDVAFCSVNPDRSLQFDAPLRLCKFADCNGDNTEVMCPSGTESAHLPNGMPGCCSDHGFEMWINCPGIDDDAEIFMRLDQGEAACVGYTLAFHY